MVVMPCLILCKVNSVVTSLDAGLGSSILFACFSAAAGDDLVVRSSSRVNAVTRSIKLKLIHRTVITMINMLGICLDAILHNLKVL